MTLAPLGLGGFAGLRGFTGGVAAKQGEWRYKHQDIPNGRSCKFAMQLDAIQFWARFQGRWLHGEEFIYPDRPKGLPQLREPVDIHKFGRRPAGR
jgi:hypothetical protein